jgi:thiosulfate sulfurtransferase
LGLVYILKNYFDNKLQEQKKMSEHSNTFKTITTEEVNDFIKDNNITILDIRDEGSFSEAHIPSAIRLSGNNIDEIIENSNHEDNILIYCYAGISSQNVAQHFCNLGFKKIYNLEGGYTEFSKEHN